MQATREAILRQLEENRRELLDLSNRNRLISVPIGSRTARIVQVFDEKADETVKKLIREKKALTFLPGRLAKRTDAPAAGTPAPLPEDQEPAVELPLPEDDEVDPSTGLARRHSDSRLQTRLSPEALQRKLFDLYNESRTLIEEQGVNILYLAVGFVKWIDKANADTPRFAPLLLIPVDLVRKSAAERFAIRWREEELQENLSLAEKFRVEFGLSLPTLSIDDPETFDAPAYFRRVQEAVSAMPGWAVEADGMCLGFFSFAKFLMYRDLDAAGWPPEKSLLTHPLIGRLLLTNGADHEATESPIPPVAAGRLDETIPADRLDHVVDADSSQTVAIELVRTGRNLVIQGPPGTGKSQTITNIIATAVLDGKKVLFVAEKLAALEVVKRRLEKEHLGVLCLELHSNKMRKADVAASLRATWELGKPAPGGLHELNDALEKQRTVLNGHPERIHRPLEPVRQSAYDFIGILARDGRPEGQELSVRFAGGESWNEAQLNGYRDQLRNLALRLEAVGTIESHPWRGVRQRRYYGTERQLLLEKLTAWRGHTEGLQLTAGAVGSLLGPGGDQPPVAGIRRLNRLARWASVRPAEKLPSVGQPLWEEAGATLLNAARHKGTYEKAVSELRGKVVSSVWKGDLENVRRQLVLHGAKWYRFLIGSYRKAMAQLQAELTVPLPKSYAERLALTDQIRAGQEAYAYLQAKDRLGREAFGGLWEAEGNAARLEAVAQWVNEGVAEGFTGREREVASAAPAGELQALSGTLTQLLDGHDDFLAFFGEKLALDWGAYLPGPGSADDVPLPLLLALQASWLDQLDWVADWIALEHELALCKAGPLLPLAELAGRGFIAPGRLLVSFNRIWAQQCLERIFAREEALARFDGTLHEKKIEHFRTLDKQRLHLAKIKVLDAHYARIPEKKAVGTVGTVLAEANKQRNHKPLRKLLREAGTVVQHLKPVFMMSPLSVAQYLEPGAIEFDLLVIDEASQVQPVDALGAVARARQIVVVGDDKQLPPTAFFAKMTSNAEGAPDDEEEAGAVQAKELESILSLCKARGIGDTLLRWHYRSRHQSLIAVSNQRYYENKLFIVPSPWQEHAGLGLKWRGVDGVYDRANTRVNAIEARDVALAVLHHARTQPDQTLGVAAFSIPQQKAIGDEVEILRRNYPGEMEAFFAGHPHEPFFVKNLENVQGDERDVIFLSVGYGKDADGRMFQNFGPLNKAGGERRLNVLISRARKCCHVFASITEQDIVLNETTREGVAGLKHFLQYTRTGIFDLARAGNRPVGSPLEEAVKEAIERKFGWEVHTQVGVAGFFIDLAVVDPDRGGRYVLGIECDGVAYHSAPSARERDRLRQSVLESQGWCIHRLWGIDFFRRPDQELLKIKAAYEGALESLREADALERVKPEAEANVFHLLREPEQKPDLAVPYRVATGIAVPDPDPYNLRPAQVSDVILRILEVEAPIHFDELVTRMREQWGWTRAADRFRNHVLEGLQVLLRTQQAVTDANFIHLQAKAVQVRKRDGNAPAGTRKTAYIPPAEIDLALKAVTRTAHCLSREEAAKEVSTALGFKSLSGEFRSIIEERINLLLQSGELTEVDGKVTV